MKKKNDILVRLIEYDNSIEGMKKFLNDYKNNISLINILKKINKNMFSQIKIDDEELCKLLLIIKNKELEKIDDDNNGSNNKSITIKDNYLDNEFGFYQVFLRYYDLLNFFKGSMKEKENNFIDFYFEKSLNYIKMNKKKLIFLRSIFIEYKKSYNILKSIFDKDFNIYLNEFKIRKLFIFFYHLENIETHKNKDKICKSFQYMIIYYILIKLEALENYNKNLIKPAAYKIGKLNEFLKYISNKKINNFWKKMLDLDKFKEINIFINISTLEYDDSCVLSYLNDHYPSLLLIIFSKYFFDIIK